MFKNQTAKAATLRSAAFLASILAGWCFATPASAHGVAGDRFFPATIATDDPAIADELSLPSLSHLDHETEIAGEYSKRITAQLGLSIEGAWTHAAEGGDTLEGFQNFETTLKWQFLTSAAHEAILAAGVGVEWGASGAARIGAEETTMVTPRLYFGKGFGDLPDSANWARPLAVTGLVGYSVPTEAHNHSGEANPYSIVGGLSLQYSVPYLTSHIRDHDWPEWVNRLTPLVEIAFERPVRHAHGEGATGTINPGLLWTGRRVQLGAEAIVPMNDESGDHAGWTVQAHFFLDDLFAHSIGRPLFGARP